VDPSNLIDWEQWDGSDFFMVWPMPRFVFISNRVASFIQEEEISGVQVVQVSNLRPTRGFSPGGLRIWMDDDRARLLGQPLDIY
jgi:hypothetical protein